MKTKLGIVTVVTLVLVALGATLAQAGPRGSAPAQAGGGAPALFNYQGLLLDNAGNPVADGDYQVTFAIYDVVTGSTALWTETQPVAVEDGLFHVTLGSVTTIDSTWVDGRSLWLGITLQGELEMAPRIPLVSVPYALNAGDVRNANIHPNTIRASSSDTMTIYGQVDATVGIHYAVLGENNAPGGAGVFGLVDATAGTTYGVRGQASSTGGTGVYGEATATTGLAYGVHGVTHSSGGVGVVGYASASSGTCYGVHGASASPTGRGVSGLAHSTSGENYGVYGETYSPNGYGVYGTGGAGSYGVYGYCTSTVNGLGVYGHMEGYGAAVSGLNEANGNGVWGYSIDSNGVRGETGRADHNYGVYTEDNLYSMNFHTLGAVMQVVQNGGAEPLERGDLVEIVGLGEPPAAGTPPIIQVCKAQAANSTAILGVVDSSYADAWLESGPVDPTGATGRDEMVPLSGPGPIAPGDYLLVVVQGPCQVKVDGAAGPIAAGDLLVSAALAGHAAGVRGDAAAPGTVLGKALEPFKPGQQLLYVYVTLR